MILHPIACGIAFIASIMSIGAGVLGSLSAVIVALVAWILCMIVTAQKEAKAAPRKKKTFGLF
jgi:predicted membrane protein